LRGGFFSRDLWRYGLDDLAMLMVLKGYEVCDDGSKQLSSVFG